MPMPMPTDRIRMLQELMRSRQQPQDMAMRAPDAPPVAQLEVDFPEVDRPLPPMDMPTEEQINTPVYDTGNETYGMGPQQTFTAPQPPSKRDSIAAALQKRRQMGAGAQAYSRPYGS